MKIAGRFTILETAKLLKVHPNTLREWEKKKILLPIRDKATNYRYYTSDLIRGYLLRGSLPKIEVHWGYDYSKKARVQELIDAKLSLDVIVSSSTTTYEKDIDQELFLLLRKAMRKGVKVRFIRNLSDQRMKERAEKMKQLGVETKNRKIYDVTISIRDKEITRVEIPSDNPEQRFNLVLNDKKIAESFLIFFEKLWK